MTRSRLYLARDDKTTAVSRGRLRMPGGRPVPHSWRGLTETSTPQPTHTTSVEPQSSRALSASAPRPLSDAAPRPQQPALTGAAPVPTQPLRHTLTDATLVVLPPVVTGALTAAVAPVEAGFAAGGVVLLAMSYLAPLLRRRRAARGPRAGRSEVRLLTEPRERAAFTQAVGVADRISETWPALGALIDVPEAEAMLADALWEIAGSLARRQELGAVLADLSRPDFAALPPEDPTARELRAQLRATKETLSRIEIDLARREASLRRAEEAGRGFIREQEVRRAIRASEESLRTAGQPDLPAATPPDAGAELAEHTQSVLAAYRELTAGLRPEPPFR